MTQPALMRFAKALWDDNFAYAHQLAHKIADQLNSADLAGYRAWWWYLASRAAALMGDKAAEQDCLRRGASCGVNSGWLNAILHDRNAAADYASNQEIEPNAEGLWDNLSDWGWAGPGFEKHIETMLENLQNQFHVKFHQGLETLGQCFGANTSRRTDQGAPDCVWSFSNDVHIAFEAKTEKKDSGEPSKKDLQEAKGHVDWTKDQLATDRDRAEIKVVVVAPEPRLHEVARPFAAGLRYASPENILDVGRGAAEAVRKLRVTYSGKE